MSIQASLPAQAKQQSARRISVLTVLVVIVLVLTVLSVAINSLDSLVKSAAPSSDAVSLVINGVKGRLKSAPSAPGALLYATLFQNPNDADWYQYQGTSSVQIANGALEVSMDELNNSIFSPLDYTFNDFDARVVVRQLGGDDPYSEYGLLFRYQDSKNYYMFKVRGDGAYHVERTLNGVTVDLSAPYPAPSFAPGANHVNDMRVIATGNQFRFYLNDQLLILCPKGSDKFSTWNGDKCLSNGGQTSDTLTDASFSDGQIGLGVYENESAVEIAFTNLVVYAPQR